MSRDAGTQTFLVRVDSLVSSLRLTANAVIHISAHSPWIDEAGATSDSSVPFSCTTASLSIVDISATLREPLKLESDAPSLERA